MDAALSEALTPVLRDLEQSGALLPDIGDEDRADFPERVSAMLYAPDGSGQGVSAIAGEPLPDRIASVADQVQEWAVEALWLAGRPATWPECPEHPDSHPLTAEVRDRRAVWACPKTGHLIGGIGQLPAPPPLATMPGAGVSQCPAPSTRSAAFECGGQSALQHLRLTVIPSYTEDVKTAISLPDDTYEQASKRAAELGISRSEFFARAARRYLDELASQSLTRQIDEALQAADDGSNAAAAAAGRSYLAGQDDW